MKNLKAGIIALILTTMVFSLGAQTSANSIKLDKVTGLLVDDFAQQQSISPYLNISGKILNSEIKRVAISVYILEDDCSWTEVEASVGNKYNVLLDRKHEYQIWFHDKNMTKVMYVDPGYQGDYVYDIDVNFISNNCVRMSPMKDGKLLNVQMMTFIELESLIYQQAEILN